MELVVPRIAFLLPLPLLCLSQGAFATCTFNAITAVNFALPASLSVSRDIAVGTVIYTGPALQPPAATATCDGNGGHDLAGYLGPMQPVSGMTGVYQTSVPGIGVKVVETQVPFVLNASGWQQFYFSPANSQSVWYGIFQVSFVVTGPVAGGALTLPAVLAGAYASDSTTALVNAHLGNQLTTSGSTSVVARTCVTQNVNVTMPTIPTSALKGVGTSAGATGFNIALTGCPPGMNSIQYEIDAVTTIVPGTGNSVVTLDGTSTASNVALQLLDGKGNPFGMGTPVTFTGYNSGTGGSYTIPFTARYYQTGTPVSPGAANTQMTFTMTYQ
jgi:major type 1 subunit fimbrin (pilin)